MREKRVPLVLSFYTLKAILFFFFSQTSFVDSYRRVINMSIFACVRMRREERTSEEQWSMQEEKRRRILKEHYQQENTSMSLSLSDTRMDNREDPKPRRGGGMKVFGEYGALLKKMFLLTKRKRSQTIAELLLAYVFLALLLGMRYLLDRPYKAPLQMPEFRPFEKMVLNSTRANTTYYYPSRVVLVADDCHALFFISPR